ncbi:hypothetical protein CG709_07455 [Lachnotalea glycerini]|nr:hypothetical protein CG709_07455 [Lachnotalea glycerini]
MRRWIRWRKHKAVIIIYPVEAERLSQAIALAHSGDRVIKVKQVNIEQKTADDCYEIDRAAKDAYQNPMEEIDSIDVVYYLGGIETRQKDSMDLTYLDAFKEQSVIGLFRLIKAYAKCGHIRNNTKLKIVTNHVYKVEEADQLRPFQQGFSGWENQLKRNFEAVM